jgi:hypothetical protein
MTNELTKYERRIVTSILYEQKEKRLVKLLTINPKWIVKKWDIKVAIFVYNYFTGYSELFCELATSIRTKLYTIDFYKLLLQIAKEKKDINFITMLTPLTKISYKRALDWRVDLS